MGKSYKKGLRLSFFISALSGLSTLGAQGESAPTVPPSPAPAAPPTESSSAGTSSTTTSAPMKRRRKEPFLSLGMDFRGSRNISDQRLSTQARTAVPTNFNPQPGISAPAPSAAPSPDYRMSLQQFKAQGLINFLSQRGISSSLGVGIPWRSVKSDHPTLPQGSEMGGVDVFSKTNILNLQLKGGYAFRRSDKLNLHDSHPEYYAGIYFENKKGLPGRIAVNAMVGPEVAYALGRKIGENQITYGPQIGFAGALHIETFFDRDTRFRFGSDIFFRRQNSYSVNSNNQGGVGLLSLTPSLEYLIIDDFWLGVVAEIPTARPVDKESYFGNTELPGLYGKSFGLRLRAATL